VISDQKLAEPLLQLQKEHESILRKGALIAANVKDIDAKIKKDPLRKAASSIRQLRNMLLEHESKEERILAPIILERLDSEASAAMKNEHVQICDLLQKLEETVLQSDVKKNLRNRRNIIDLVGEVDSSIRAHFSREENVLFWLASLHMSNSN